MSRAAVAAVVLFALSLPLLAADAVRQHSSLTIGSVAFNPDQPGSAATIDPVVAAYLGRISKRAVVKKADLHFDVVRGNYYQVLRWMRDGTLDGAIVSPFLYRILLDDSSDADKQPFGAIELVTDGLPEVHPALADGNAPAFRVLHGETPLPDANAAFDACVLALVESSRPQCTFDFVSHLSTTGFLYPLVRINDVLKRTHGLSVESVLDEESGATVMDRLLERTRFTLWHDRVGGAGTRVVFSYASKLRKLGAETVRRERWMPLFPERRRFAHDVIAISGVSTRAEVLRDLIRENNSIWTKEFELPEERSHYVDVRPVDAQLQQELHDDINRAFPDHDRSNGWWTRWYVDEEFEFTVPELVGLLRNDQKLQARDDDAAIVLPGGGVRGAYQAQILDELYARYVANGDTRDDWCEAHAPLVVQSVVGTSGGALMGYFAARRYPGDHAPLTARWLAPNGAAAVRVEDVFPMTGALRWLSILISIAILALCAAAMWARNSVGVADGVPLWLNALLVLLFALAPAAVFNLAAIDRNSVPRGTGLVYVLMLVLTHMLHSVIAPGEQRGGRRSLLAAIATLLCGGVALGHTALNPSRHAEHFTRELLLAASGLLLIDASLFLFAWHRGIRPSLANVRRLAKGAVAIGIFWSGVLLIFGAAWLGDRVTTLELTGDYWLVLLGASLFTALLVISLTATQTRFGHLLDDGLDFWFCVSRTSRFFYNPMLTLLGAGFAALISWVVFVAPALYDGDTGARTFRAQAKNAGVQRATFIAALTNLGTPANDPRALPTGDYYAVERGARSEQSPRLLDWDREHFLEAVSASGSPFPIYPGRKIPHERGTAIFVDGGFTHLVPIEGAVKLMRAKQVLVVSNAKRSSPAAQRSIFSLLVSDSGRTFNLLFDRAQQSDAAQNDVIVATIAPAWKMDDPFLMDFRPQTIQTLVDEAWRDLRERRPGRVTRWGQPTAFLAPPERHPHGT
ncbi:MAG TPA: patatin-like phospholipase family protein [Thermoanaerobaculia bacterium]|jgi:hypothetical protein